MGRSGKCLAATRQSAIRPVVWCERLDRQTNVRTVGEFSAGHNSDECCWNKYSFDFICQGADGLARAHAGRSGRDTALLLEGLNDGAMQAVAPGTGGNEASEWGLKWLLLNQDLAF